MSDGPSANQVLDGRCASQQHPLSILDLSVPNAQLAGVLAGFMILAITTVLTMSKAPDPAKSANKTNSLGTQDSTERFFKVSSTLTVLLLGQGIIVLALDALFFGTVGATRVPATEQNSRTAIDTVGNSNIIVASPNPDWSTQSDKILVCERAWLHFLPAAGLLAVGGVLLVAGLAWLIAPHRWDVPVEGLTWSPRLSTLGNFATVFVMIGMIFILGFGSIIFADEMRDEFHVIDQQTHDRGQRLIYANVAVGVLGASLIMMAKTKFWFEDGERGSRRWFRWSYISCLLIDFYLIAALPVALAWSPEKDPEHGFWVIIMLCTCLPGAIFLIIALALPENYPGTTQGSGVQRANRSRAAFRALLPVVCISAATLIFAVAFNSPPGAPFGWGSNDYLAVVVIVVVLIGIAIRHHDEM